MENPDYSQKAFWESKYSSDGAPYDWYLGWPQLTKALEPFVKKTSKILFPGVGTSSLPGEMFDAGFKNITVCDFSSAAITAQKRNNSSRDGIKFAVADVTKASPKDLLGTDYDVVIDKGLTDALLCGDPGYTRARRAARRLRAVLKTGGHYICITNAADGKATRAHHFAVIGQDEDGKMVHRMAPTIISQPTTVGEGSPLKEYFLYAFQRAGGDVELSDSDDDIEALAEADDFFDTAARKLALSVPSPWKDRGDPSILTMTVDDLRKGASSKRAGSDSDSSDSDEEDEEDSDSEEDA